MLRDLAQPSRIMTRANIAVEALRDTRKRVIGKVKAMAATPFRLER